MLNGYASLQLIKKINMEKITREDFQRKFIEEIFGIEEYLQDQTAGWIFDLAGEVYDYDYVKKDTKTHCLQLIKNINMETKRVLATYYTACQILADHFVHRYFGKDVSDMWWIGDEVGGVLAVNDYFFDMEIMEQFLRYRYSKKLMFEYYEAKLEADTKGETIANIKNWRHFRK